MTDKEKMKRAIELIERGLCLTTPRQDSITILQYANYTFESAIRVLRGEPEILSREEAKYHSGGGEDLYGNSIEGQQDR